MKDRDKVRTTFERNARALKLRPSVGMGTATTRARLVEGLRLEVEDGNWKHSVDMSEKSGGSGSAPDPGVYGRTALASCLSIAYAMWAANLGVDITALEVEVQADYNSAPAYGASDDPPGYRQVRYTVTIESESPEEEVLDMLDQSDAHCAYLDIFKRPLDVQRTVKIKQAAGTGS